MGIDALPLSLLLLASTEPSLDASHKSSIAPISQQPISELIYQESLLDGDVAELQDLCTDASRFNMVQRMREIRDQLMLVAPAPQSFEVVLDNARALMICKAPTSAQTVLSRVGPAQGLQRREWLLLSWEAANAALDHAGASLALRRLVNGDLAALDQEVLPVAIDTDGTVQTRSAFDLLVEHEQAMGNSDAAISVLLASRTAGAVGAARLGIAADLLAEKGLNESIPLLESALDQAAADEAWGLALDLLRLQLKLELAAGGDAKKPSRRLQRLARQVDDKFSLWQLIRQDKSQQEMAQDLNLLLRSPREPGGHAFSE